MKNLFSRTFSLLCAVTLLICAVSSWAFAEEPATPTDLTAEEGTVQAGTNNSGGSNEDPAESVEILITKSLKLGESWEGVARNTRPAILKLDLDKAETIYMILEGNHAAATIQKADRPEEILYTVTTDPDTKQAVISWEAEQGSYLITIEPDAPYKMVKAVATFLDEKANLVWEEVQEKNNTEEGIVAEEKENNEQEAAEEKEATDMKLKSLPERSVSMVIEWDNDDPVLGDTAHMNAVLKGYDGLTYSLQWQNSFDCETWNDIPGGTAENLDVMITEENNDLYWRVLVYLEVPVEELE